jgi:hypothetical protein
MTASHPPSAGVRRAIWTRLAVIAGAVALGLALQQVLGARLAEIDALAQSDVIRARAELAGILRVVAVALFGLTGWLGVAMLVSGRRALAEGSFPPSGIWSWGSGRQAATGPRALRLARAWIALAIALILCSVSGGALTWYMASVLLACRAGAAV